MSDRTYEQAAQELNLPVSWLQKKVAARQIPHTRYGRHVRFTENDLTAIRTLHSAAPLVPAALNVLQLRRRAA